jgi:transposase InsO family protein
VQPEKRCDLFLANDRRRQSEETSRGCKPRLFKPVEYFYHTRYLLHDRDHKYCSSFRQVIEAASVKTLALPPRSPNLNAYAERWVRSVKEECLAKLILLGEGSLRRALRHYQAHYHEERNHQGKDNVLLFPLPTQTVRGEQGKMRCRERLGGLLKYYEREAA